MNNSTQAPINESGRLSTLLDLVFSDALKIAKNEEEYEVCADLLKFINDNGLALNR